jgi:hypothetical protein
LACSAGARSVGAGCEGASAGRGGGKGGDAAVDALEACSGKASIAVIMKNARMRMRATQVPCGSSLIHRALIRRILRAIASFVADCRVRCPPRGNIGTPIFFSHIFVCSFLIVIRNSSLVRLEDQPNPAIGGRDFQNLEWNRIVLLPILRYWPAARQRALSHSAESLFV